MAGAESTLVTDFSALGLAEPLLRALNQEGYTNPTPIQEKVIPPGIAGRDIVGVAQTGTGKTAAFVLPLLHHIQTGKAFPKPKSCTALILAPTRELVSQIADSVSTYGRKAKPAMAVMVGGVKPGPQARAMAPGVDILVATPGRLLDHLDAGAITLSATQTIVLDEADQMMDLGFMPAIRRIMAALPKKRQTFLLSATMPKQIRKLADDFLKDPVEVAVTPQSKPVDRIAQRVIHTPKDDKKDHLIRELSAPEMDQAIVFTRTKHGADKVKKQLEAAGLKAVAIHGNKTQGQRTRALTEFKKGRCPILVATDVAARGLDIDGVSHVINYELPNVPESYVHRIGRTARAGRSGIAIAFCCGEERGYLRDIEKLMKMKVPAEGDLQEEVPPPVPGQNRGQNRNQNRGPKKSDRRPQAKANRGDGSKPQSVAPGRPKRPKQAEDQTEWAPQPRRNGAQKKRPQTKREDGPQASLKRRPKKKPFTSAGDETGPRGSGPRVQKPKGQKPQGKKPPYRKGQPSEGSKTGPKPARPRRHRPRTGTKPKAA